MQGKGSFVARTGGLLAIALAITSVFAMGAGFDHGPYTGAPSRDAVAVSWTSSPSAPARVDYEPLPDFERTGEMTLAISVPALEESPLIKTSHVTLANLLPATDYVYRVTLFGENGESQSPVGAFSTAPDPGDPISFIVLADTQQQLEGVNRLALVGDAIAADPLEFDFILHAGDVVESPSTYYWDDWFSSFDDMLLRAPFIPVLGNHERNHRSYYDAFELPPGAGKNDERWWALHWGDVVVVGLDSNVKKATDYTAQQGWATTHLSGPEPHKFVIFHHPVFTSDAFHGSGTFLDKIYHPIFVEAGVDIVFNGHSHHYEHVVRDGVTYLVVGGGGATPRQTKPEHIQGSDVSVEGHFFYVRVSAAAEGIGVETVAVAEQLPGGDCTQSVGDVLLDSFTLGEDEPAEGVDRTLLWIVLAGVVAATMAVILLRTSAD